jgi:hypothetical protein
LSTSPNLPSARSAFTVAAIALTLSPLTVSHHQAWSSKVFGRREND